MKTEIIAGEYYWVKQLEWWQFEPAKAVDRYGDGRLFFCFTDGSVAADYTVHDIQPLPMPT